MRNRSRHVVPNGPPVVHEIMVANHRGVYVGTAGSFGEAKEMQRAALPPELRDAYAGIGTQGQPLFHEDALPQELAASMEEGV